MRHAEATAKATKAAAQYEPKASDPKAHCGICRHYLGERVFQNCEKIEGHVQPQGWCKFFQRAR